MVLDQDKCRYTPRVLGVRVGQPLSIRNSDPLLHNVRANGTINQGFNMSTPLEGVSFNRTFATKEVMVPFKCDVHGWMSALSACSIIPYFGTTAPDGTVVLGNLPPGTYTIEAWHEALGTQDATDHRRRERIEGCQLHLLTLTPTGARALAPSTRSAFAHRRLRHADEAAPQFPGPADDGSGLFARRRPDRRCPDLVHTLVGTFLVAGGAAALNQVGSGQTDRLMRRTRQRPIADMRMCATQGTTFGLALTIVGAAELAYFINPLSAAVALFTTASYVFFYTPLKLRTSLSTIAGALPGALPAVIGWAAATNTLSIEAWVLFGIVFMWQMPHFLAIAWMYRDEYARAGMPLLPVIEPDGRPPGGRRCSTPRR